MTERLEKIGNITLELSKYPGEDYYCDGTVEDELLQIVKDRAEVEYPGIIAEKKSWPILYHLSSQRENIVNWLPITKQDKVLEIGSGCGAITGVFSRKAGEVTCVDLSKKRSSINAYRHADADNVTIHVGNFQDIEPELPTDYDYICLIGVFEYGRGYIGGENPYEDFLTIIKRHLKKDGRIVIAIENKYGLKYWAGCKEDHMEQYYVGIEDYKEQFSARTFSKRGLEKIFANVGLTESSFYYPYPDYKFMTTIYSDEYLPKVGELANNMRNFEKERLIVFDERAAFDGIIREGDFPEYSNSFLVILGPELPEKYAKFSNDRAPEYAICTKMIKGQEEDRFSVMKCPLTDEAIPHIEKLAQSHNKLKERYEGSGVEINRCVLETDEEGKAFATLEYLNGITLAEKMDSCLFKNDIDGFMALFEKYCELLEYRKELPVADYDLIFANILITPLENGEEKWTIIDYEWTVEKVMEPKEIAFRALYCYILEDDRRNILNLDIILKRLNVGTEEREDYQKQEKRFQHLISGRNKSMYELYEEMHGENLVLSDMVQNYRNWLAIEYRVQIFEDTGAGFSQEQSYYITLDQKERSKIALKIPVDGNVRTLRVDPAEEPCLIQLKDAVWNGVRIPLPQEEKDFFETNGKAMKPREKQSASVVFASDDPNLVFHVENLERRGENLLEIEFDFVALSMEMAVQIRDSVKKIL